MDVHGYVIEMAERARTAACELARLTAGEKNAALVAMADALVAHRDEIAEANAADVVQAREAGLSPAMVDRLTLTDARFDAMVAGVRRVAELPDPVGDVLWTRKQPSGITISKVRVPLGVIAVVFESRPNVFVDTAALCLKTGNAVILRGGKEAIETNRALAKAVSGVFFSRDRNVASPLLAQRDRNVASSLLAQRDRNVASPLLAQRDRNVASPLIAQRDRNDVSTLDCATKGDATFLSRREENLSSAVQLVDILDHSAVTELVRAVGLVDVAIPRGGERLIRAMCEAALVPVLKHYKGVCHIYVDDRADLGMALSILDNAKTQRPGVCNAAECLLIHEKLAPLFLPMVRAWADDKGVTLHFPEDRGRDAPVASEWEREFLSLEMNVGLVADHRAAARHINRYGSHHSDCIVTNDAERAAEFLRDVDSAAVYHNVSTRFTDGAEFGMGAEIGISTDKLHARGPMGLEELTTYKYVVTGDGIVRK